MQMIASTPALSAVSIHAPVKGATLPGLRMVTDSRVSIHAPVKGATVGSLMPFLLYIVSIHAPVKGATPRRLISADPEVEFQSTRP